MTDLLIPTLVGFSMIAGILAYLMLSKINYPGNVYKNAAIAIKLMANSIEKNDFEFAYQVFSTHKSSLSLIARELNVKGDIEDSNVFYEMLVILLTQGDDVRVKLQRQSENLRKGISLSLNLELIMIQGNEEWIKFLEKRRYFITLNEKLPSRSAQENKFIKV